MAAGESVVHGETIRIRGQAAARLLLGVGLWACAGAATADTPVAADDPACPSQDFTRFLQRFADPADDRVRLRYTSDPLEYEVPMHTVRDDHQGLAPTHVVLEQAVENGTPKTMNAAEAHRRGGEYARRVFAAFA